MAGRRATTSADGSTTACRRTFASWSVAPTISASDPAVIDGRAVDSTVRADVLVAGGGPSGAVLARRLAQLGHSVVIAECEPFPRPHVGESLGPGVLPLLDVLGIRRAIEGAGFLRPTSAIVSWAGPAERRPIPGAPGFQVDRSRFDHIVLASAAEAGARLLQPARVLAARRIGRGHWLATLRSGDGRVAVECRFIADATGRRGLLGGTKRRSGAKTVAMFAYWAGVPCDGPETRVEAGDEAWYWGAPLPDGQWNAAVFVDPSRYRDGARRAGGRDRYYESVLDRSALLRDWRRGRRISAVHVGDATQRFDEIPATMDAIKVGEASFAIDPLSSQGVQAAIGSALHAAAVIHTVARRPDDAALALAFYRTRQRDSVELHSVAAAAFYAEAATRRSGDFWTARAPVAGAGERASSPPRRPRPGASARIGLAAGTRLEVVPTVRDAFIVAIKAVVPPGSRRPVALVDGIAVGPLAEMLQPGMTVERVLDAWSAAIPYERAVRTLGWLWDAGVVCDAASGTISIEVAPTFS